MPAPRLPSVRPSRPRALPHVCLACFGAQDPEDDWGSRYSARNKLVRDLTALGVAFDHYGGCKFGADAAAASLPSAQVGAAHTGRSHDGALCREAFRWRLPRCPPRWWGVRARRA